MLNNLAPQCEQYSIKASDAIAGQTTHIDLSTLSDKRSETDGLHCILKIATGARVRNIGKVRNIVTNSYNVTLVS